MSDVRQTRAVSLWDMLWLVSFGTAFSGPCAAVRLSHGGAGAMVIAALVGVAWALVGVALREGMMSWAARVVAEAEPQSPAVNRKLALAYAMLALWLPTVCVLGFGTTQFLISIG